ncbi:ribonucleases P/MRP protein subunit POP1-domain-containing protein [Durotheca rogersii]|uniref:ribonucleases P/MRP protein subunit POP1-domain-containing protein n=1 Tax=Durotheca rogersii TaxID=419775 RepID=UPI00221FF976|nr:ribonucleases P/MRP protein subunit POP1-domain-containing protein [Durotheca rogersii]KAI5867666.1 ribonucleases P/MRP protein subunit POP1-domain-containing protein [Durotheca rogersii]
MKRQNPAPGASGNLAPPKPAKRKDLPREDVTFGNPGRGSRPGGARDAKRAKLVDDRSIAAQPSHAALQDGELNVQSFVNSLSFEINAMDESMRRTKTNRASRAFQRVPFRMRRRAAAHNHKRIPRRLQARAKREMAEDNTPTVNSKTRKPGTTRARLRAQTARKLEILARRKKLRKLKSSGVDEETISVRMARPKIRRNATNQPIITARKFRKRQISKTWLPTHLWHAKRARMTPPTQPLWRFAIPLTPTQKVYRPTHRIQWEKGAMAWDMSYMSTIGLSGAHNSVQNVLKSLGLTQEALWNDKAKRWRSGDMHWTGMLSRRSKGVSHVIGPGTIIWNPVGKVDDVDQSKRFRQLYVRVHPSAFLETFNELLRLTKMQHPRPFVEDLRFEVGSIDVTGPDSTEALLGVLKPYLIKSESREPHASRFESLAGLRDPGALPAGTLLAFSIVDPRLCYPPRQVAIPSLPGQKAQATVLGTISALRKEEATKPYQLFDRDVRFKASKLPSQRSLNRRRGKGAPGTALKPTAADPPIPVILLASHHCTSSQSPSVWTVMLPWKCVLPVWHSLMHYPLSTGGNPWFGGLDEIRQLTFERGLPWFPGDMPGTDAGKTWELDERCVRYKAWDRMPKGKRVNWESFDLGAGRKGEIGTGWSCDYELLFGLETANPSDQTPADGHTEDRGSKAAPENENQARVQPLESVTQVTKPIFTSCQSSKSELPLTSLITVEIKMLARGVPATCARIYRLPDAPLAIASTQVEVPATMPPLPKGKNGLPPDLYSQWVAKKPARGRGVRKFAAARPKKLDLEARKQLLAQQLMGPPAPFPPPSPNSADINGHPLCPDEEDLIGFVTTGSFNLRDGRGEAIGSLSATRALEEFRRYEKKDDPAPGLCIVRNAGQNIGWLARWKLI